MISYKPLWKTLVEKEMKKTDLLDVVGISRGTLTKLSKNAVIYSAARRNSSSKAASWSR